MKKRLIISLFLFALLFIWGCSNDSSGENKYIGLITNTAQQSNASVSLGAKQAYYNSIGYPISHVMWPDNFMDRQDEVRKIVHDMLDDSQIGALIVNNSIPGFVEALANAEKAPSNCFIVACNPSEQASIIASQVDLVLALDVEKIGSTLVEKSSQMGANTLVYYTLERYLKSPAYAQQLSLAEQTCADMGIVFVSIIFAENEESDMPLFLQNDVSEKVLEYGKDTAFFLTSNMQYILAEEVINCGGIYACPSFPSPFYSFMYSSEIDFGNYDDYDYINTQIAQVLQEKNALGRFSNFNIDWEDLETNAAYEYSVKWLEGDVPKKGIDLIALQQIIEELSGTTATLRFYEEGGETYENYVIYSLEPYIVY